MIINNNIPALNTYRQLGINQNAMQNSMEKLSSGLRINRAGDDAAGLAISEKMRAQIKGLDQASRNAQDGISLIQTAEGALDETHSILQRMRELAVQSSNDTNVEVDREELQKEIDQLSQEISRIGDNTEFNTQNLLDGSFEGTFHIGANEGQNLSVSVDDMRANSLEVVGDVTFEATGGSVSAGYTAVDNTGVDTGAGETEASATITNGTYTVEDDGAGGFNLVDGSGNTVATSTDRITFTGNGANDGTADSIKFGSPLSVGDSVKIDTGETTAYVTYAESSEVSISNHSLEAGNYSIDGSNLVNSKGDTIATFDANENGYVSEDGTLMLESATEIADQTELSVGGIDISSQGAADEAISTINQAIERVSAQRSELGAFQNRLEHTISNLDNSSENLSAAESRIRDVDMAKEMMEMTRANILSQASQSMLAQANQMPQSVLQLLG